MDRLCFLCSIHILSFDIQPLNEWELGGPDFSYVILVRTTQSGGDKAYRWAIMKVISDYQQGKASFNVSARQRTDVTITSHNSLDEPANEEFIQIEPLGQRKRNPYYTKYSLKMGSFPMLLMPTLPRVI